MIKVLLSVYMEISPFPSEKNLCLVILKFSLKTFVILKEFWDHYCLFLGVSLIISDLN